jgi:hypothetical protein
MFHEKHELKRPRRLTAVRARTIPENVTPDSTTTTQPKPENVGEGAEPRGNSTTKDDPPKPSRADFKAYHAYTLGVRQTEIATSMRCSQATVHRKIKRVERWLAAGNELPGLDELDEPESRPRTFSVDPAKMERFTEDDDE